MSLKNFGKSLWYEGKKCVTENIFPFVNRQSEKFKDKWLVNRIRLGVTGLSKSGKTTFITSLIYHLMRDATLTVSIEPDFPQGGKKFPYEENINRLKQSVPEWVKSTDEENEICLKINDGKSDTYLEIVDYPGEWLLDLPLMEKSFSDWSKTVKDYLSDIEENMPDWVKDAKGLADKACDNNEDILEVADKYRFWLHEKKKQGFNYLQPGRFVMPDTKSDIYTLVNFFPWVWDEEIPAENALFKKLESRYNKYKEEKVIPFYKHFKNLNKQIILVDCLYSMQKGGKAWRDLKFTLGELLQNFSYGRRNAFVSRLLNSFKIDTVLFVATKADYISYEEKRIDVLTGILKSAAAEALESAGGIELKDNFVFYRSIAAVSVQEINNEKDEACFYFPDGKNGIELPDMLTQSQLDDFRDKCAKCNCNPLNPRPMNESGDLPNIEMFNVIKFIIGD